MKIAMAATKGVILGLLAAGGIASAVTTTADASPVAASVDSGDDGVGGLINLKALGIDVDGAVNVPAPRRCGYSAQGMDAHFRNCSSRFVLVRSDWDNGRHYTTCLGPWDEIGLYHDGTHRQVRARAVPKAPVLITTPSGRRICASSQPDFP